LKLDVEYRVDISFDELYTKLSKFIAATDWTIKKEAEVIIIEDGKKL